MNYFIRMVSWGCNMHIKIENTEVCKACKRKSCARNDVVSKSDFYNLKSERNTCPIKIISNGPSEEQLSKGFIDIHEKERKIECLNCGLCVKCCSKSNLKNIGGTAIDLSAIKSQNEIQANNLANVIATSYLNSLFDFSANTNLNKNLRFDGYVRLTDDEGCFVETDINDDSLECCRRLIGDFISYNSIHPITKIDSGLVVLENLPKKGSHDIYTLVEKIRKFPKTAGFRIYFTTLPILQFFFTKFSKNQHSFLELFYLMTEEDKEHYIKRLIENNIISKCDMKLFD